MIYAAPLNHTPIEIVEDLKTLILNHQKEYTIDGLCNIPFGNPEYLQLIINSLKIWVMNHDVAIKLKSLKILVIIIFDVGSKIKHIVFESHHE